MRVATEGSFDDDSKLYRVKHTVLVICWLCTSYQKNVLVNKYSFVMEWAEG